jgi:predicted DNA-binding protein (MmcQ/YjbR family)
MADQTKASSRFDEKSVIVNICPNVGHDCTKNRHRPMTFKELHAFLAKLPSAKLSIQWGNDHVYKVGGKMFSVLGGPPDGKERTLSFKATDESFEILTRLEGIIPAPYLARAKWVYLDKPQRLPAKELKAYLTRAHALVASTLTKKAQKELGLLD